MKNYVLASHNFDEHDTVSYYIGMDCGEYYFGPVQRAKRFDLDEILDFMKQHHDLVYLGFTVIRIEDCTFDLIEQDKNDLRRRYSTLAVVR